MKHCRCLTPIIILITNYKNKNKIKNWIKTVRINIVQSKYNSHHRIIRYIQITLFKSGYFAGHAWCLLFDTNYRHHQIKSCELLSNIFSQWPPSIETVYYKCVDHFNWDGINDHYEHATWGHVHLIKELNNIVQQSGEWNVLNDIKP